MGKRLKQVNNCYIVILHCVIFRIGSNNSLITNPSKHLIGQSLALKCISEKIHSDKEALVNRLDTIAKALDRVTKITHIMLGE